MPKKILLAEDSLTIQKVFELTFAQSDFALTMVDNGTDAVRLASEILPDLVVADITLPGRNGFEVASDLAASASSRIIPVLVLSGSLGPFDEVRFKGCGARGVLFKPFESQELIDKVNEMLSVAEAASAMVKGEAPVPGAEEWDFSDVLEEVDDNRIKAGVAAPPRRDDFLPVSSAPPPPGGETLSFGDFDVSVEETGEAESIPAAIRDVAPSTSTSHEIPELGDVFVEPPFSPGEPCEESPAGITDISPALAEFEELEEIEDLEEMELLHKESDGPLSVEPFFLPEPAPAPLQPAPEAYCEDEPEVDLEAIIEAIPESPAPPMVENAELLAAEALREQFSARAREIVEKVATDAVEKVMWEWMDRLSSEFTERIRESVESVAWDVIPRTAEALIREEIARIREKDGKQGESR